MNRREAIKVAAAGTLSAFLPTWLLNPWRRPQIDLMAFCSKTHSWRFDMRRPFLQAEKVYATDARIAVCVAPATADVQLNEMRVPPAAGLTWNHDRLRGWQAWPKDAKPIMAEGYCPECDGTGVQSCKPQMECDDCCGFGMQTNSCGDFHPHKKCRHCKGFGYIPDGPMCETCKGRCEGQHPCLVKIGTNYIDVRYYRRVLALPDTEFVAGIGGKETPIPFRFGGGRGLLMPVMHKGTSETECPF